MMLLFACQAPTLLPAPHPPPTAFSYAELHPPRHAGVGSIQLDGEAGAAGQVTLDYVARVYVHVRPLSGVPFTKVVHYRWAGPLPDEVGVPLMGALSAVTVLEPATADEPALTLRFEDGDTLEGGAGAVLEPTLLWLQEHREPYTPSE